MNPICFTSKKLFKNKKNFSSLILQIKEKLRKIPNKGINYGILKHITIENLVLKEPEIGFNFLGNFDEENEIINIEFFGERNQISNLINFDLIIYKKKLQICSQYNKNFYFEKTIENLVKNFKKNLIEITNFCCLENNFG
jgi:non-ribosomal peptide synthase protein (TIGR01720 family)